MGAVLGLILIRTTGRPLLGTFVQWDILLPAVVYFGQRRTLPEGIILTLFSSHLYSLSSAAPVGVFASFYLCLFVIARLVSYVLYASTWISILLLIFTLSLASRFLLTGVATAFGHGWPLLAPGNFTFSTLLLTSVMGYLEYGLLGVLDLITYKTAAANIELSESQL